MSQEHPTNVPCSIEQLRTSLVALYVHQLRIASLVTAHEHWPPSQHAELQWGHWATDVDSNELGVTYNDIKTSAFAQCMEQQFQFGVHGVLTTGQEPMEYETQHTWVAAHLMDLATSEFVREWESYGPDLQSHAHSCLLISELANARLILEGSEMGFSHFSTIGSRDQDATGHDGLTIRQMALLSGLEEMSVRTAASRKGPNQLITQKNAQGRTIVSPEQAKAWLQARGKYIPVTKEVQRRRLDLSSTSFRDLILLTNALYEHCSELSAGGSRPDLDRQVGGLFAMHGFNPNWRIDGGAETCEPLLRELASLLELPEDLLLLRVKESALREQLASVETSLKLRTQSAT